MSADGVTFGQAISKARKALGLSQKELYTAACGVFLGAEYANRDGSNERRDIVQPIVSRGVV